MQQGIFLTSGYFHIPTNVPAFGCTPQAPSVVAGLLLSRQWTSHSFQSRNTDAGRQLHYDPRCTTPRKNKLFDSTPLLTVVISLIDACLHYRSSSLLNVVNSEEQMRTHVYFLETHKTGSSTLQNFYPDSGCDICWMPDQGHLVWTGVTLLL